MPSPIGHSIIGLCIYALINRNLNFKKNWKEILLYMFLANLADIDAIPQLFGISIPFIEHREFLHSILFAFIVAAILSYFLELKSVPSKNQAPKLLIFFLLIFSHPLVDIFNIDTRIPAGVMLLWPFSESYYISPLQFLPGIQHAYFAELFAPINYSSYLQEIKIFGSILLLVYLYLVFLLKPEVKPEAAKG